MASGSTDVAAVAAVVVVRVAAAALVVPAVRLRMKRGVLAALDGTESWPSVTISVVARAMAVMTLSRPARQGQFQHQRHAVPMLLCVSGHVLVGVIYGRLGAVGVQWP